MNIREEVKRRMLELDDTYIQEEDITFEILDLSISDLLIGEHPYLLNNQNIDSVKKEWNDNRSTFLFVLDDLYSTIDEQIKSIIKSIIRDSKIESILNEM